MKNIKTPEELLKYMSENISYGYLGNDNKVHLPSDMNFNEIWFSTYILENYNNVLKTKIGNCWDQVEFEREWFTENGFEVKTFYEQVILDYKNPYPTHSFLTFKKEDNWYWFENSDEANRGIHKFNNLNELLDFELDRYKSFLKKEYQIKNEEINNIKLFEFDKPRENMSAKEYIMYVTSGIDLIEIKKYVFQNNKKPKYLFHGSPKKLTVIETRQSSDSKGAKENIDNAVFLTPSLLSASAYAFKDSIKENSKDLDFSFHINDHGALPVMTMENVHIINDLEGYIYVFEMNNNFKNEPMGSMQYKSYKPLKPIDVIKVKYKDFKKYYKEGR